MAEGPIDYVSMLPQPDFGPLMQGLQLRRQNRAMEAQQQVWNEQTKMKRQEFAAEHDENAGYQASVAELVAHPTFDAFAAHTLRYPKQVEASKAAWGAYEPGIQTRNMGFMTSIHGLISAGKVDAALDLARSRQSGLASRVDSNNQPRTPEDTQQTDAIVSMLESGDPKQIAAAKGMAFMGIGIAAGPDKFANVINAVGGDASYTLAPGSKRFDRDNKLLADAPFAPDRFTLGPGETRYEGSTGGSPAPGAGVAPSVGDVYSRMVTAESGGRQFASGGQPLRSPKGAVGAAQIMPATGPEAAGLAGVTWDPQRFHNDKEYNLKLGQAYFQKQFEDFADPAKAAAAYNAGPGRVRSAINRGGDGWLSLLPTETQNYVRKVAGGDTQGGGTQAGDARATASGGPRPAPEQARRMSPDEVRAEGLDAGMVYYRNKDGVPTPVQGQAKPKPGAGGDQAYSQSAMDSFDRAIGSAKQLLSHKGLSAAVGSAFDPSAIGSFNPFTGETLAGTNAADFMARLTTLKAQVFLPMVQSMKGMGALSNAEGEKLTAAIGALDTKQSEAEFKSSLNQVVADLNTYKNRAAGKGGGNGKPPAPGKRLSVEEAAKLPPGTRFIGTDGKSRVRQ
jgi:hypothetical protein